MEKVLAELSAKEFKELVEHTIDRRLEVWFTQLLDAWTGKEDKAEFQPEFAASLKRALEQAHSDKGVDLQTFRDKIGR